MRSERSGMKRFTGLVLAGVLAAASSVPAGADGARARVGHFEGGWVTGSKDGSLLQMYAFGGTAIDSSGDDDLVSCLVIFGGSEWETGCGALEIVVDPVLAKGTFRGELATTIDPVCCWEGRPGRVRVDLTLEAADVPIPSPIPPGGGHQCGSLPEDLGFVGAVAFGSLGFSRAATATGTIVSDHHGSLASLVSDAGLARAVSGIVWACARR